MPNPTDHIAAAELAIAYSKSFRLSEAERDRCVQEAIAHSLLALVQQRYPVAIEVDGSSLGLPGE